MAVLTALFHAPFNAVGVRQRCRDAWLVRPRKGITNEYALLFERTHEPYVPTCLLPANHKGQSSMLKVQSQPIIKVKVQCSKFKAKVPTCVQSLSNLSHFTVQPQPYYTLISPLLRGKMGEIGTQHVKG